MENNKNEIILNKEIDLIQSCINRMAHNSFIIKGWAISLITIILTLLPENFDVNLVCIIGLLITICFWSLDGFFLKTEKLYRWKYEWVIVKRLETDQWSYDLNPYNSNMWLPQKNGLEKKEPNIFKDAIFTKTLVPIYLSIIFVILIVFVNTYV
ncbi:hypothetical protein [Turicibacter bilis]|uniref:hypothetical protein n=1 Tax=Turicibacter bilis TaxID=2735723 RepID=UPI001BAED217|nr:hypothetical protein [Turicibacter bilis]MBS3199158.1 hypothetical protein [Turicibacter bilis]